MTYGERGHDTQNLHQAAGDCRTSAPAASVRKQWRRQQQREQKKKMVRAFCNVANAETEYALKPAEAGQQSRCNNWASLDEVQLIQGLIGVAVLCGDPDILVAWYQTVH